MSEKKLDDMTEEELLQHQADLEAKGDPEPDPVEPVEPIEPIEPVEDPEEPTDPEADPPDPYAQLLKDAGLDKQYESVEDLVNRTPDTNRYLTKLEQENAEFRKALLNNKAEPTPKKPAFDPEAFEDKHAINPQAFADAGLVTQDKLNEANTQILTKLDQLERQQYNNQTATQVTQYAHVADVAPLLRNGTEPPAGANPVWDAMVKIQSNFEGVDQLPLETKIKLLRPYAQALVNKTNGGKPPVNPVSQDKKDAARTTNPKGAKKTRSVDFNKMSEAEILKEAQATGMVTDD